MKYIYFDETGDLSFQLGNHGVSNNFVLVFLFTSNPKELSKVIKKTIINLNKKDHKNMHGYLHAYKERRITIMRLLKYLSAKNVEIISLKIDKSKLSQDLRNKTKPDLYNYLTNKLLNKVSSDEKMKFIAAQRESKPVYKENFKRLLEENNNVEVEIVKSKNSHGLQVADFVAWALYCKYERNNFEYFDIIKDLITHEYEF